MKRREFLTLAGSGIALAPWLQGCVSAVQAKHLNIRDLFESEDPAVLAELAPFITPGYFQIDHLETELKPLSYSKLLSAGALAEDTRGLSLLVKIAIQPADKVRPRWKMNWQLFVRYPNQVEKAKHAQALLIELGPVLVEMGKLQP